MIILARNAQHIADHSSRGKRRQGPALAQAQRDTISAESRFKMISVRSQVSRHNRDSVEPDLVGRGQFPHLTNCAGHFFRLTPLVWCFDNSDGAIRGRQFRAARCGLRFAPFRFGDKPGETTATGGSMSCLSKKMRKYKTETPLAPISADKMW